MGREVVRGGGSKGGRGGKDRSNSCKQTENCMKPDQAVLHYSSCLLLRHDRDEHGESPLRGGQNDDFQPLTCTLGGRGMGCMDKYVTS
jgi:hypothetical protein